MNILSKNTLILSIIAGTLLFFGLSSCIDDKISTDTSLRLSFSTDTLFFDTIFTTIGSSTAKIKVYNPNNQNLVISSIGLAKGSSSSYSINVDGASSSSNQFTDIELRSKDSLFIFVEVKIDPQEVNTPVFVKDSIVFLTNDNYQDIKLLAYGQNMEILKDRAIFNDTLLTAEKPYLVYGDLTVDSAKTLTLAPGCRLYFHNQASLIVYGNLIAEGTRHMPILMRGDRTDQVFSGVPYNFVSNQWTGVLLLNKHGRHVFNHVTINSAYVGIYFTNSDRGFEPSLEIHNSRLHNFLKYGLVVQNGDVTVTNTEISNTGSYAVYLSGGKHTFIHSTMANYFYSSNIRLQPSAREGNASVMISELDRVIPMESKFLNCVVAGSLSNEFEIFSRFEERYNGLISHSYLRKSKPDSIPSYYQNITWYNSNDTIFRNTYFDRDKLEYYNFCLDSVSPARGIADINIATKYPIDLNGNNRLTDGKPDAGAYEWFPNKQ